MWWWSRRNGECVEVREWGKDKGTTRPQVARGPKTCWSPQLFTQGEKRKHTQTKHWINKVSYGGTQKRNKKKKRQHFLINNNHWQNSEIIRKQNTSIKLLLRYHGWVLGNPHPFLQLSTKSRKKLNKASCPHTQNQPSTEENRKQLTVIILSSLCASCIPLLYFSNHTYLLIPFICRIISFFVLLLYLTRDVAQW